MSWMSILDIKKRNHPEKRKKKQNKESKYQNVN